MELNENTQVKLDLKTIAILVGGVLSVASTYFTLQGKIDELNNKIENCNKTITIGLLGKYNELNDSYKSLLEAISHAGIYHNYNIN